MRGALRDLDRAPGVAEDHRGGVEPPVAQVAADDACEHRPVDDRVVGDAFDPHRRREVPFGDHRFGGHVEALVGRPERRRGGPAPFGDGDDPGREAELGADANVHASSIGTTRPPHERHRVDVRIR
jgi:hypothetical protein